MIKFETMLKVRENYFGGNGTTTYEIKCDATDTIQDIEKQLREKYPFHEEYPGCSFVDDFYKMNDTTIRVTFRSYSCD